MKEKTGRFGLHKYVCLLDQRFCDMEEELKRLKEEAESAGLYININKTKGMRVNTSNTHKFRLGNTELKKSDPLYTCEEWCQRMEEQMKM